MPLLPSVAQTYSNTDTTGIIVVAIVVYITFFAINIQKGKPGMAIGGLLYGLLAIIGAIRIAKPDSSWAKKNYAPGSVKWQRQMAAG